MFLRNLIYLFVLLSLSACSATIEELRASPSEQGTFTAELPYATVFERLSHVKGCEIKYQPVPVFAGGSIPIMVQPINPHSENNLEVLVYGNSHDQESQVDISQKSAIAKRALLSINLRAEGNKTEITYFGQYAPLAFIGERWREKLDRVVLDNGCL